MILKIKAYFFSFCLLFFLSCKLEKKEPPTQKPDGKTIYMERCTSCHGMDGKLGFGGAKNLITSNYSLGHIINQVTHGKGAMAGYKNILTAEEIFAVSEYAHAMRNR